MYTSIIAAAALASVASALPSSTEATTKFEITPKVVKGDSSFDGYFLAPYHVGAGEQTLVASKDASAAAKFYINGTTHVLTQYTPNLPAGYAPYKLSLVDQAPYGSDAPKGYNYVALNLNGQTAGFGLTHNAGTPDFFVGYDGSHVGFGSFALCNVNGTSPNLSGGHQKQLLWRNKNQTKGNYLKCADIALKIKS